eukprot:3887046-Amphidinium_carterae.3
MWSKFKPCQQELGGRCDLRKEQIGFAAVEKLHEDTAEGASFSFAEVELQDGASNRSKQHSRMRLTHPLGGREGVALRVRQ